MTNLRALNRPTLNKLGLIFTPSDNSDWIKTHAYLPTAILLDDDRIRVYLAFRDADNVGRVGWIDVSSHDPLKVLSVSAKPCLDIGDPGCFDDNGVSPMSIVKFENRLRLYYVGWQLTPKARYLLFTGLAFSDDGGDTFVRAKKVPVLDRSNDETIVRSGAYITFDEGVWKAWYAAGSGIIVNKDRNVPTYHLAYAESQDGIKWPEHGDIIIRPNEPDEYGFGRPWVTKNNGQYHMYYSIRSHSETYTIGYGVSDDGKNWKRLDNIVGIDKSKIGWDSEMVGFASVVVASDGRKYMFYNGNGYGETGVGVAQFVE